jgi:hypothetical protein
VLRPLPPSVLLPWPQAPPTPTPPTHPSFSTCPGFVAALPRHPHPTKTPISHHAGQWRAFSGNEIGAMLAHWVLANYLQRPNAVPVERLAMLSSTVSSRMLEAMAAQDGFYWQVGRVG